MYITAQGCRLRNDLYCVEWDVKLYYTIPYFQSGCSFRITTAIAQWWTFCGELRTIWPELQTSVCDQLGKRPASGCCSDFHTRHMAPGFYIVPDCPCVKCISLAFHGSNARFYMVVYDTGLKSVKWIEDVCIRPRSLMVNLGGSQHIIQLVNVSLHAQQYNLTDDALQFTDVCLVCWWGFCQLCAFLHVWICIRTSLIFTVWISDSS